ncbi:MAG: hypothetical protein ACTSR2_00820 [Candidatus Hodarchaeales archaeon]
MTNKESVATDGFSLIRVQTPSESEFPVQDGKAMKNFNPFILPKEEAEKILKNLPSKASLPILENFVVLNQNQGSVEFGITDLDVFLRMKSRTIEGEYPGYGEILTRKGRHIRISVDKKFLKRIVDFFNDFVDSKVNEVILEIPVEPENPIRFIGERNETGQKAEALLMPLKEV